MVLAVPAAIHSAASIATLRNIPAAWLPESLPLRKDFARFVIRFGITDVVLVSWPGCELDAPSLDRVRDYLRPQSAEWGNPSNPVNPSDRPPLDWFRDGGMIRDQLSGPPLRASPHAATQRLAGSLVGPDGHQTCIMLSLAMHTSPRHREVIPELRRGIAAAAGVSTHEVAMVGGPVDGTEVDAAAIETINQFSLPSSLVAVLLCWIFLRSVPMTGAVVGTATVGQGLALAVVYYAGLTMNAVLIVLPPLVFVLTVSAGIHLCNYYLDLAGQAPDDPSRDGETSDVNRRAQCASEAMKRGVRPCIFATLTTVVGLSSLALVRLQPVWVFGLVGAGSIVATLAMLILILPGAMMYSKAKRTSKRFGSGRESWRLRDRGWERIALPPPWLVFSVFATSSIIASIGLTDLRTSVSVPAMFASDSDLRTSYRWFEKNIGATLSGDVIIDFNDDVELPDQYEAIARLHGKLRQIENIGGVLSAANFLPAPMNGGSMAAVIRRSAITSTLKDPTSPIQAMGFLSGSGPNPTWRIALRIFQTDVAPKDNNGDFGEMIQAIEETADKTVGTLGTASVTGHFVIVEQTQRLLLGDLFKSFLAALVIIAVLMMAYLRSVLGGLIAMIPNIVPTLLLFGWMGHTGTPLDIGSVMTASVALGIAVDDTVHLLARFRSQRAAGKNRHDATVGAVRHCGWAMLQTTVVCGLALMVYGLSRFIPTQRFAMFMLALLAVAFVGAAVLLPALMRTGFGKTLWRAPAEPASR
ncbi:MMPL family protein [Rubripirellula tenax]|uniref:MMPL family protein n=2 Tax=Rubripirellula tenax TaxID=2528015 RepID=A0A5C6ETP7_9BACT|nr:MMPL family protein [Rubripirellula tenax]